MCGRYTLHSSIDDLQRLLPGVEMPSELEPRYNVAPTQAVAVVPNDGSRRVARFRWGLVPSWAKDPSIGHRLINARAETLAEKPSFRRAFRERRCLVLADGFYEWRREPDGKTKTPVHVRLRTGEPFAFAGLWETWQPPAGEPLRSCTIITTTPNELVAGFHSRMPVILRGEHLEEWSSEGVALPSRLQPLLAPCPAEDLEAFVVSRRVNSPAHDDSACLEPA